MPDHNTPNKKELDPLVVANYFLQLDSERVEPDVTQLKLHKIMYFAQANYLGATGSRLFSSRIEASPRGPIVLAICSDFKKFRKEIIVADDSYFLETYAEQSNDIPEFEMEYLRDVWDTFSEFSAAKLQRMIHEDTPWKKCHELGARYVVIPDDEIEDWYRYHAPLGNLVPVRFFRGVTDEALQTLDEPLEEDVLRRWGLDAGL